MSENNALIELQQLDVVVLFSEDGMKNVLEVIEEKALSHVPDVSTESGRDAIKSLAYKVARSKTLIDDQGKNIGAAWKEKFDRINKFRKQARDSLDALKVKVRKPLTIWEDEQKAIQEEEDRKSKEKLENRIDAFIAVGAGFTMMEIAAMTDDEYEIKLEVATVLHEKKQREIEDEERQRIADRAELARLRKLDLDRIKAEEDKGVDMGETSEDEETQPNFVPSLGTIAKTMGTPATDASELSPEERRELRTWVNTWGNPRTSLTKEQFEGNNAAMEFIKEVENQIYRILENATIELEGS